jgi:pyruvate/2-oxoglutarate dehydrogenase complex dihydrolipoamide dehydrogenase (E3) component
MPGAGAPCRLCLVLLTAMAASTPLKYDLVVVGGGAAGLSAAKFASRFKKSVLLVEKAKLGGDCTWTGCVPSKTLLSIAKTAHAARTASHGISVGEVKVDMRAVKARIDSVVERIYTEDDSPEALRALGIETMTGTATFTDPDTLSVGGLPVVATKGVVLATGADARPALIPGLDNVPHYTYESVFALEALPRRLTVVGGGPVGVELAQAFSRLGSAVTLVAEALLPGDEPEAGQVQPTGVQPQPPRLAPSPSPLVTLALALTRRSTASSRARA